MPTKTDFGDLTLYASTGQDAEETFLKFRTDIAGTNSDSNFNKIANILSSHDFSIKNARKIFDITATKIAENYYESNDFEIQEYSPHMLLIFSVSDANTGDVTININSLGDIQIKKFDNLGNLVELNSNDLIKNTKYLLEYNGDSLILLNQTTANEILEKIKAVDGSGSGLDADLLDGKESTDFATSSQGAKADTAIQSIKGNGSLINPDENKSVNITPENIGAVPISRTINNKSLEQNITLSPDDIGAAFSSHSHSDATSSNPGFMSSNDKSKLDGISSGATRIIINYGKSNPAGGSSGDIYFKHS